MDATRTLNSIAKYAPVVSVINYLDKGIRIDIEKGVPIEKRNAKFIGHSIYAVAFLTGLMFAAPRVIDYTVKAFETGRFSPSAQKEAYAELASLRERHIEAWQDLVASVNQNGGAFTPEEQIRAARLAGLIDDDTTI